MRSEEGVSTPDVPTQEERDWLLDEMAKLISVCGAERFLSAPLLSPDESCFPDDVTRDMEGVRLLILRLLDYAGLPDLEVRVTDYSDPDLERKNLGPHVVAPDDGGEGIAAFFAGISEGVCQFGVEESQMTDPQALLGVLSHEVAHVWRRTREIEASDLETEEHLTDLSTIYLGYGVLATNASYRYEVSGNQQNLEWRHSGRGYLPCEAMSFLLAVHCMARQQDAREIAGLLDTTQRAYFRAAYDSLAPDDLTTRLGLPPVDNWPAIEDPNPQPLKHTLSENQQVIEVMARQCLSELADEAPFLVAPYSCNFSPEDSRHQIVMTWGVADRDTPIECKIVLVEVQSSPHQMLVFEAFRREEKTDMLLGLLHDDVAWKRKALRSSLAKLFDSNGMADYPLLEYLPSYVYYPDGTPLRLDDMQDLMFRAVELLDPTDLEKSVGILEEHAGDPWARMAAGGFASGTRTSGARSTSESQVAGSERERKRLLKRWWDVVTEPEYVEFEMKGLDEVLDECVEDAE